MFRPNKEDRNMNPQFFLDDENNSQESLTLTEMSFSSKKGIGEVGNYKDV